MIEAWLRVAEQAALYPGITSARVLGITSSENACGVSTFAKVFVEVLARSGSRALLLDLSRPAHLGGGQTNWSPGSDPKRSIIPDTRGYDRLIVEVTRATRFAFNDIARFRGALSDDLSDYDRLVLDLPPLVDHQVDSISPAAAAAACDSVLLVCARGRTTYNRIREALELSEAADIALVGTILNNLQYESPGIQIALKAKRLSRVAPKLAAWIKRNALSSDLLN